MHFICLTGSRVQHSQSLPANRVSFEMSNWQTAKALQDLITTNCICFHAPPLITPSHFSLLCIFK